MSGRHASPARDYDDRGGRGYGSYHGGERDRGDRYNDRGGGGRHRGGSEGYRSNRRRERSNSYDRGRSNSRDRQASGGKGSDSRERSRERERRRRKLQADCIRRAGGYQMLADIEGKEPVRLFWDGFQWVAKTGHSTALQSDPALMNSTRKMRRLYFGNLPLHLGLTETSFQEIVWEEMKKRNFCNDTSESKGAAKEGFSSATDTENPVLCVWFAKDKGNYGFVEFASVEETERALLMDGMSCLGVPLKVSRPNDYTTTSTQQNQAMALMGKQSAQMLQMQHQGGVMPPPTAAPGGSGTSGPDPEYVASVMGGAKTPFLRVVQIVGAQDLQNAEDCQDILDDIKEGFEKAGGTILRAKVVMPPKDETPGVSFEPGDVIIEFENSEAANQCMIQMHGRKYEDKPLQMVKLGEEEFRKVVDSFFGSPAPSSAPPPPPPSAAESGPPPTGVSAEEEEVDHA